MSRKLIQLMAKKAKSAHFDDQNITVSQQSFQDSGQYQQQMVSNITSKNLFASTYNQFIQNKKQIKNTLKKLSITDQVYTNKANFTEQESQQQKLPQRRSHDRKQLIRQKKSINSFSISKMGIRNYDNMENQDTILIDDYDSGKIKIYGLFDGHGQNGKQISQSTSQYFKKKLRNAFEQLSTPQHQTPIQQIVKKTLIKTNDYLITVKNKKAHSSGTSALIVIIFEMKMYFFNIGNSRAVLFKNYDSNKLSHFQITLDQTLARFDERLRVINSGAVIKPLKTDIGKDLGPQRLWFQGKKYPGVYITRSLGMSYATKLGVISQSQLSILMIKQQYKFVLMATDGLWDVISNSQVLQILQFYANSKQLRLGISKLLNQATQRWAKNRDLMDDITEYPNKIDLIKISENK